MHSDVSSYQEPFIKIILTVLFHCLQYKKMFIMHLHMFIIKSFMDPYLIYTTVT